MPYILQSLCLLEAQPFAMEPSRHHPTRVSPKPTHPTTTRQACHRLRSRTEKCTDADPQSMVRVLSARIPAPRKTAK
ncbi:hypothetical protein FOPG_19399 [Fusarium oxysporum f. sp. conglutinans race 2 54008]|uniref:Uncharacterized protein n=1 Tax=Fusarium oxysporum f. sp. conglutinans race 2 54008 TaxID=1089457 RepID=X0HT47_FUSOX|nr:hypothetical protein FOPG_19399 [Fusarium oxysporum f. sp. conglutinans race 2 54008]